MAVGPGQEHETHKAIPLLEEATAWPEQPAKVAGDKGYSAGWLRDWLGERGIKPVIAHQKKEKARRGRDSRGRVSMPPRRYTQPPSVLGRVW